MKASSDKRRQFSEEGAEAVKYKGLIQNGARFQRWDFKCIWNYGSMDSSNVVSCLNQRAWVPEEGRVTGLGLFP